MERESVSIDMSKVDEDARFDGKWVLKTNTQFSAETVALKYKELRQVEHTFRDLESTLETRPVFHQRDEAIRGHVFCSFLALVLRKVLQRKLEEAGHGFSRVGIKQDLEALQPTMLDENGKSLAVRSQCQGTCGKIFQAVGVAISPTVQQH
jgi:transposase